MKPANCQRSMSYIHEVCHEKTDLKVFVVVMPKEVWMPTFRENDL